MAAGSNPLAAMVMSALQARSAGAGGGQPGGAPGQTGMQPGGATSDEGGQYAQQVAELKGADPGMLGEQLKKMKQMCAVLMVQNLERLPNVAGKLSKLIPMFDSVLKEVQQASSVNSAVRQPIQLGAAQPPMMSGQ